MRPIALATLLTLVVAGVPPAHARPKQDQIESLAFESGTCKTLVTLSKDLTDVCGAKLVNTTWRSGRAGFYFVTTTGIAVTFSGMGDGQIHPNPDVAIQPVDLLIFGKDHETQKAVGSCRFSNPFHGVATVDCEAQTAVGEFKASFVTDGNEPDIKRF